MHYLYKITNKISGKVYIGQTNDFSRRWATHKREAGKENPKFYIHRAMNKYGTENFTMEIIDFALNQWQANCLETNLIRYHEGCNTEKGYNVKVGVQDTSPGKGKGPNKTSFKPGERRSPQTEFKKGHNIRTSRNAIENAAPRTDEEKRLLSKIYSYRSWKIIDGKRQWTNQVLTTEQIQDIKDDTRSCRQIAKDYGFEHKLISKIKKS